MYIELLSLFTAFCYGVSAILVRIGMRDSNPLTGAVVGGLIQVFIISIIVAIFPPERIDLMAVTFFIAAGILAGTLGRLFNYMSIERLGVPVSATIVGSSPLFSTLFAILFIGEKVAISVLIGTIMVLLGIAFVRRVESLGSNIMRNTILLPIGAAAFYGASSVVRKMALNILPDTTFGALIGSQASLFSLMAYLVLTKKLDSIRWNWSSGRYFFLIWCGHKRWMVKHVYSSDFW